MVILVAETIGLTVGVIEVEGLGFAGFVGGFIEGRGVDPPAFGVQDAGVVGVFDVIAFSAWKIAGGEAAGVVGEVGFWGEDVLGDGVGHGDVDFFAQRGERGGVDFVEAGGVIFVAEEVP
jgi:hypothetical protein